MLRMICNRMRPSHLSVRVGGSSRRREEKKKSLIAPVSIIIVIITRRGSKISSQTRGRNSSVGSAWARCQSVAGSILLWGHFPVEGIFPLELTWVQTPFPQNSFGWEYKPRSSLCTHAFHRTDSKDPDVHVLAG